MASDLFDNISHRAPAVRPRRPVVVVVSIAGHVIVFLGALFLSLATPGLLPRPRVALAFFDDERRVQLTDIALPAPPRQAPHKTDAVAIISTTRAIEDPGGAPLVAPTGIAPDTDHDAAQSLARSYEISRIEAGSSRWPLEVGARRVERLVVPTPQAPVRLHSGIQAPIKLVHVDPSYPALAQSARIQGVVILEAVIDGSGRVESVQVIRSIPMLDQAAIAAVRQWRYTPAMLNGAAVPVIMTITVNFKL